LACRESFSVVTHHLAMIRMAKASNPIFLGWVPSSLSTATPAAA
jgi:hypothetical protein